MASKSLTISRSREKTTDSASTNSEQVAGPQKIGFVSLGCPKNLVDSEVMMGLLARAGAELSPRAEDADVIVVNTCSFIESAQQESVNTILEMAGHKTSGRAKKLVVAGCLVERFRDEIREKHSGSGCRCRDGGVAEHFGSHRNCPASGSEFVAQRFTVRGLTFATRRRCQGGAGTVLARAMGRGDRGSPELFV